MKKLCLAFFVLIVPWVLLSRAATQSVRSGHGEFCNAAIKCDKRAWLTCQREECECMFLEEMIYDNSTKKCISKAGERCKFQVSNPFADADTLAFYEKTDCVPNADCAPDGICNCVAGYYEFSDGSCLLQKTYNESCTADVECNQANHLSCIDSRCACKPNQILNERYGYCSGKAGLNVTGKSCVEGSEVIRGVCTCTPVAGFYDGQDGRCHKRSGHLGTCSEDRHCLETIFLSCHNGTCTCNPVGLKFESRVEDVVIKQPKSCVEAYKEKVKRTQSSLDGDSACDMMTNYVPCGTYYDEDDYELSYVESSCIMESHICDGGYYRNCRNQLDESPDLCKFCKNGVGFEPSEKIDIKPINQCVGLASQPCSPNSACVSNSKCSNGQCICNSGYATRKDGTCGIGHGSRCSISNKCSDNFVCGRGEICKCPSPKHQVYDSSRSKDKCVSLVRGPCESDDDCFENTVCQPKESTSYKQCVCRTGFVENSEGRCDLAHGSSCIEGNVLRQCDRISALECIDNLCSCPDSMTHFDPYLRTCLGLEGTRCKPEYSHNGQVCVNNAVCLVRYSGLDGSCVCKEGFNSTKNRFCEFVPIATTERSSTNSFVEDEDFEEFLST